MLAEMDRCSLVDANLTVTNLMGARLRHANLSGSRMIRTVLIEADLKDTNISVEGRSQAYTKFAKF